MVPPELRRKTVPAKLWPASTRWCAGCQSFVDLLDVAKGASQCRACVSGKSHGAMIAKVYGLTPEGYDALLEVQGGKCAICRARPVSKRLAVDHDHQTQAVRGLLCSRCNHELMGAAWDSSAIALALWHYINTPPAAGQWLPPEQGLAAPLAEVAAEVDPFATPGQSVASTGRAAPAVPILAAACSREHFAPIGSVSVPGREGSWQLWVGSDSPPPF